MVALIIKDCTTRDEEFITHLIVDNLHLRGITNVIAADPGQRFDENCYFDTDANYIARISARAKECHPDNVIVNYHSFLVYFTDAQCTKINGGIVSATIV